MFLDFPVDTGYSFLRVSSQEDAWSYGSDQIVKDFIHFMKQFYTMHPQYVGRELYLAAQDFSAGQYLPKFVQAIQDLRNGTFIDEDFDIEFLDVRDKEWNSSFNIQGIMLSNPLLEWGRQRYSAKDFALTNDLVDDVQHALLGGPADWCKQAHENTNLFWWKTFVCSFVDTVVCGNPIYPIISFRNIHQNCSNWFNCLEENDFDDMIMNLPDLI